MLNKPILFFALLCFSLILSTLQAGLPQPQSPSTNLEERQFKPFPSKEAMKPISTKNKPKSVRPKKEKPKKPKSVRPKKDKPKKGKGKNGKAEKAQPEEVQPNIVQGDLFWPKAMRANKRDASTVMSGGNVFEGVVSVIKTETIKNMY